MIAHGVGARHWYRQPTGGRMLAGCPGTPGTGQHPIPGSGVEIEQDTGPVDAT